MNVDVATYKGVAKARVLLDATELSELSDVLFGAGPDVPYSVRDLRGLVSDAVAKIERDYQ